jgi:hypothetical protein
MTEWFAIYRYMSSFPEFPLTLPVDVHTFDK